MWLFFALLTVPLIEIALFIQIGGLIGLWPTLAFVVLTAVVGTILLRHQGSIALADMRRSLSQFSDPTESLAHGAMILVAGVLLLTPGFFTDALGLALLSPAIRRAIFRKMLSARGFSVHATEDETIIMTDEGEIIPPQRNPRPSGWTRH